MRTKAVVLAAAVMVMWGLKRHYADARAEDLWWMLAPTTRVVSVVTGQSFVLEPGEGYLSRQRLFVIEKSCAGINFLIAAFGMSAFALHRRMRSCISGAAVLAAAMTAAYATAVVVNAVRITTAMWLAAHPPRMDAQQLHRLEGIAVYFGGLMLLYWLVRRFDSHAPVNAFEYAAPPLAWYYAITLAVPLANGTKADGRFIGHAVVVLVFPLVLIVFAWCTHAATLRLFPQHQRRRVYESH